MHTPTRFHTLLNEALSDRGVAARGRIESVAREADELEFVYASYVALVAWGEAGVEDILQIASDKQTVKHKSAALTVFAALAASARVPRLSIVLVDSAVRDRVNAALELLDARKLGRDALRRLIVATETDDLLAPISQSFMHLSIQPNADEAMGQELVAALSAKWFRLGPAALDAFEALFVTHSDDEPIFQRFLCRYPQLLDPMAIQVWSQPAFHGALVPDFVVRRADDSYLVVEIETPAKSIMTRANQVTAATLQAERQVFDYEEFLSERVQEARTHFPGFSRAERLVVIGQESILSDAQRRGLRKANSGRQGTRIVGFDWLLRRARTVIDNIAAGQITVVEHHRII